MAGHYRGTPTEVRALSTYIRLMRASDTVHTIATRDLAQYDLTASQFAVLEALYHIGPMCLSELAAKILKTSGNLTMVVSNLEKRGLAVRRQGANDRRFVTAEITEKGRQLIRQMFPEHVKEIVNIMRRLTPAEQATLGRLCRKLGTGE